MKQSEIVKRRKRFAYKCEETWYAVKNTPEGLLLVSHDDRLRQLNNRVSVTDVVFSIVFLAAVLSTGFLVEYGQKGTFLPLTLAGAVLLIIGLLSWFFHRDYSKLRTKVINDLNTSPLSYSFRNNSAMSIALGLDLIPMIIEGADTLEFLVEADKQGILDTALNIAKSRKETKVSNAEKDREKRAREKREADNQSALEILSKLST